MTYFYFCKINRSYEIIHFLFILRCNEEEINKDDYNYGNRNKYHKAILLSIVGTAESRESILLLCLSVTVLNKEHGYE